MAIRREPLGSFAGADRFSLHKLSPGRSRVRDRICSRGRVPRQYVGVQIRLTFEDTPTPSSVCGTQKTRFGVERRAFASVIAIPPELLLSAPRALLRLTGTQLTFSA
jgi:hypothetical protein